MHKKGKSAKVLTNLRVVREIQDLSSGLYSSINEVRRHRRWSYRHLRAFIDPFLLSMDQSSFSLTVAGRIIYGTLNKTMNMDSIFWCST